MKMFKQDLENTTMKEILRRALILDAKATKSSYGDSSLPNHNQNETTYTFQVRCEMSFKAIRY